VGNGRPQLTIVSRLAGRPIVLIWMRMRGANDVVARGWRQHDAFAFETGDAADDNLTDGRKQHSIHDYILRES